MSIGKRLAEERKRAGYTRQEQLGNEIDVSFTTISRWEKEESPIPSDKLLAMGRFGLNINYILQGKTRDVADYEKNKTKQNNELRANVRNVADFSPRQGVTLSTDNYAWIPLYDVKVSAGHGAFSDTANILTWLSFTKYSLNKRNLNAKNLFAVIVHGDSMYETLKPNDCIFVDVTKCDPDGGIFVLRVGDAMHVKRLIREKDCIRVISDNTRYPEWTLDKKDDFEILGKYEWLGRYAD